MSTGFDKALPRARLSFEQRCKSRLLVMLDDGAEAALFVERGRVLHDGDRIRSTDGREIAIVAAEEELCEAVSRDWLLLTKAAYHLGNRHVAVQVMADRLRFAPDHVLENMVEGLGLTVRRVKAAFEPEGGAYGALGGHRHDPEPSRPRIHSFGSRPGEA